MTTILSVALENHPGALSDLLTVVAEAGINIHAIEAQAMGDFGGVRLLVADAAGSAKLLRGKGYDVVEADVLELVLPNSPGILAKVAKDLAKAEVNVVSLFGTTPVGSNAQGRLLLRVNKTEAARKVLNLRESTTRPEKSKAPKT